MFPNVPSKSINKEYLILTARLRHIPKYRKTEEWRVSISNAFVTLNGSHIETLNSHGVVAVSPNENSEITKEDVSRVIEAAQAVSLPSTREIVHVIPRDFVVNSQEGIKDPVGMSGVRLEVETNVIHGSATAMRNIAKCVNKVAIDVDELVYTGLASAEAVLTDTEKNRTLLVDIGGGTSVIAFLDGSPVHSAVLPIGGKLITSDLAIGLRSRLEDAEKIKIRLSTEALISKTDIHDDGEDFDVSEFDLEVERIPRIMLYKIVNARLEEIFRLIALEVTKSGLSGKLPAGVVITGGAAMTAGTEKSAKVNLKMPVRIGVPRGVTGLIDEIKGPDSSAAVGAVLYGAKLYRGSNLLSFDNKNGSIKKGASKILSKLKSLLP